jgi:hypothetical protein
LANIRVFGVPRELKSLWWTYLKSVGFFKDCFSVLMWSFQGLNKDKFGPHYMRSSNMLAVETLKLMKNEIEAGKKASLALALNNNQFYYNLSSQQ